MSDKPIDVEATPEPTQAMTVRETGGAVGRTMTVDELHRQLQFVREVMAKEMKEGVDYGKIPGTGDKPSLLQPGAQKLLLTFNLTEQVKKEVLREYPNMHREYEFVVTITAQNGKTWDGVGTCSTLESKYRYRKAERRCPECGKNKIIQGKAEYGGGFICYKKKGGCGAKFAENDQRITDQPAGDVENDNPADCWNTVRKMAFKRALVAAAINATNTSELWTQDLEDMRGNEDNAPKPRAAPPSPASPSAQPANKPASSAKEKPGKAAPYPTQTTRLWMLNNLGANPGGEHSRSATEYFRKIGQLMPNETVQELPLRFVPLDWTQLKALRKALKDFEDGAPAQSAYSANKEKDDVEKPAPPKKAEVPPPDKNRDPEWWYDIIISVPRKGMKKAEYDKKPDTIGALWELRHGSDDEAAAARQRLFGLVHNWDAKPREYNGKIYQPSEADVKCREALDAFADWFKKNHPGEEL